jgi:hypothetical protein
VIDTTCRKVKAIPDNYQKTGPQLQNPESNPESEIAAESGFAGADGFSREQTIETSIRKKPPEGD